MKASEVSYKVGRPGEIVHLKPGANNYNSAKYGKIIEVMEAHLFGEVRIIYGLEVITKFGTKTYEQVSENFVEGFYTLPHKV